MKVHVRFFALYRERAGREVLTLDLPSGSCVSDLTNELLHRFPDLLPDGGSLVTAINAEYANTEAQLKDGDEVALIPPVSGGDRIIEVTDDPLVPEEITDRVRSDSCGAVVTFLGTVRDHSHGRNVEYLEYEAYPEMAVKELEKIRQQLKERWKVDEVAISHRTGRLEIGEVSLVVAVASPHRVEAFKACQEAIDIIKQTVPVWKKEVFRDGYVWVGREGTDR